jgi:hypothetical protein
MLDTLDGFESIEAGPVTVRLDPDEAPALRHYAVPMVKDAMAQMGKRYGFDPQGPILVEIFPKHDDFAVRTLGLPGLLGALGACFGRGHLDSREEEAGRVQLAGHTLARDGARLHDAALEVPRAALADRRHLGLRRGPAAARMGPRLRTGIREGVG